MTSLMPATGPTAGRQPAAELLLDAATLAAATDAQLDLAVGALLAEQHRRALAFGDLPALVEQAFTDGFTSRGEAALPWLVNGLLICPGHIRYKSATSHDCCFVSAEKDWVWEKSPVHDEMRQIPGPKTHKQSITILFADEGLAIDVVESSAASGGGCQMKRVRSFQVRNGTLAATTIRARPTGGHR